jgi:DNA-binding protein YbaB
MAGKETFVKLSGGETKTNIANNIVDAINEATKKVNKKRENKTVQSFKIWKRSNPGKNFEDYKAWRKTQ